MKRLGLGLIALAAGVGGVLAVSRGASAQIPAGRLVTVVAEGEARAEPDVAFLNAGVQADGVTPREAMAKANAQIQQVTGALRGAGIPQADIQTSNLSLFALTAPSQPDNRESLPRVIGFRASSTVSVAVRDLSRVENVLDAAVEAGITNLGGLQFGIQDTSALQQQALADAVRQARPLAQAAAQAAALTLGEIESITELTTSPASTANALQAQRGGDAFISGGTLSVRVRVQVSFRVVG